MVTTPLELDKIKAHAAKATKFIDERHDGYAKAKAYHDGTALEVIANPAIARALAKSAEAHKLAFAAVPVVALFDKIELSSVTSPDARAAELLAEHWDESDLEDEADEWHVKAGYFGDYYAIIDPIEEEEGTGRITKARLIGSSPLTTVVIYDPTDGRTPLYGLRKWAEGKTIRAQLFYDDATIALVTKSGHGGTDAGDWAPYLEDDDDPEAYIVRHPAAAGMLLHHFAVDGKPYGQPVHRAAWGPQDAITKINATHLATMDSVGFPSRYALLDPTAAVEDDDMGEDFGDTAGGSPADRAPVAGTNLKDVPGAIKILRGVKSVGQFDAAGADHFLASEEWQVRAMAVLTGTPLFEFDLSGEQPSGESRRRASGRINKHARKVKRTLGRTWQNIASTLLTLGGFPDAEVVVNWLPTETETDKEGLELVSAKVKAGVKLRAALLEAGYTGEQIEEWYPDGQPAVSPELLTILADALAKLGTATTLGTLTSADLAAWLPDYLTATRPEEVAPVETDDELGGVVVNVGDELKAKSDALGALVRAGADAASAAKVLGLEGIDFPNLPTTVRAPEAVASELEEK